jgi:hypothetical protein
MDARTLQALIVGLLTFAGVFSAFWFASREWRGHRRAARRFDRHHRKRLRENSSGKTD